MWSVFRERVDLYIGQRDLTVSSRSLGTLHIPTERTKPLFQGLDRVAHWLGEKSLGRARLHIALSGARCPAFSFVSPANVTRPPELAALAAATGRAAAQEGDDAVTAIDASCRCLGARMSRALLNQLLTWADAQKMAVASIRPLWSIATQHPKARHRSTKAIVLYEPDSTTLITQGPSGLFDGGTIITKSDEPMEIDAMKECIKGDGVNGTNSLVRIRFAPQELVGVAKVSNDWYNHWRDA